jgi:hypothetical protein
MLEKQEVNKILKTLWVLMQRSALLTHYMSYS